MNGFKKYIKIILGCAIIGLTLNIFFLNRNLIPSGTFGLSILLEPITNYNLSLTTLFINIFFLILGFITINKMEVKKAILPSLLIPLFIFLSGCLNTIINLNDIEPILTALYGGVLMGIGYQMIYKENYYVSASDIIILIVKEIILTKRYIVNYILDIIWIIIANFVYGLEGALYSVIAILIMEILSKRAFIGISDSKVFYIITKKDKEVRKYIIDELNYELTMFDVKGGFLQTRNKVLMSVIPTKDYYKLKEGIKAIDPKAFISITDSYEVIKNKK